MRSDFSLNKYYLIGYQLHGVIQCLTRGSNYAYVYWYHVLFLCATFMGDPLALSSWHDFVSVDIYRG